MKFDRLGWVAAASLLGCIVGMGFQAKADKTGIVDLNRVFAESEYAKKQNESIRNLFASRQAVVDFIKTYRTLKPEDANKFRELSTKATQTAQDKAEIERIRTQAQADEQKYKELTIKSQPTAADVSAIEEMNRRRDATARMMEQWGQEFNNELQAKQDSSRTEALQKVKESVQQVAKDQGYTIVFAQDVAPYSANDITDAALKVMNTKK